MKLFIFIVLFICSISVSAGNNELRAIKFSMPRLSPERVVELTEKYLYKEKRIDLKNYKLGRIDFMYYSSSNRPKNIDDIGWTVGFECKEDKAVPGCDLLVGVSNDMNPKFTIYPGM